jgi:SOS-response transcriptional repressor LexA
MTQQDEHGARILAFVERYQHLHHRSPTYREIGAAVGLASNDHVARDLRRLVEQGYLSFTPGVSRSIVLLKRPRTRTRATPLPLPRFGLTTPENSNSHEDLTRLAANLFENERDTFILRANGPAFHEASLEDGDLVVIKRGEEFIEGQMLALWMKNEKRTALKYLYHENGYLRLQSANPEVGPMWAHTDDVLVRGTVLAFIRKRDS